MDKPHPRQLCFKSWNLGQSFYWLVQEMFGWLYFFHLVYTYSFLLTTLCPKCKESDETHTHFLFKCKLSQTTLNFINEVINLNYTFQSPFEICIKYIFMGTSSHSHDGMKLEILPTLIEVFLRQLSFYRRKAFCEDWYNKIHELSNYKGNLISRFNALRDMSIALGSKESFLKKWNSPLSRNGTLNIKVTVQFKLHRPKFLQPI